MPYVPVGIKETKKKKNIFLLVIYLILLKMAIICKNNSISGMQVLVDAREKLDILWGNNERENDANDAKFIDCSKHIEAEKFVQWAPLIRRLWQDRGIRRAYERRREFQIVSNCLV